MILDVIDEEKVPYLTMTDRMVLILFDLGITNRAQIEAITGWTKDQVKNSIHRIRELAEKAGEDPDKWVRVWRPFQNQPSVYSLGELGIAHARALRGETTNGNGRPLTGHIYHFLGLNEILVRLIQAGLEVEEWLSGKESASWVYHSLLTREEPGKQSQPQNTPLRPDAMITINGVTFMVEYDTGTEPTPRLEEKFHRYLALASMLPEQMPTVLFITVSEKRRQAAVKAFERAVSRYPSLETIQGKWDHITFLIEGEEVIWFQNWLRG